MKTAEFLKVLTYKYFSKIVSSMIIGLFKHFI